MVPMTRTVVSSQTLPRVPTCVKDNWAFSKKHDRANSSRDVKNAFQCGWICQIMSFYWNIWETTNATWISASNLVKHCDIFKSVAVDKKYRTIEDSGLSSSGLSRPYCIYTTITHNNTSIKYQKPTGKHNNKAEDANNRIPKTCSKYRKIHLEVKKL